MRKWLIQLAVLVSLSLASPAFARGLEFEAELTGDEAVPGPVMTDTTGEAEFKVNRKRKRIKFSLEVEDAVRILAGPGGHLHCGAFGETGPIIAYFAAGLPVGLNGDVEIEGSWDDGNILPTDCGTTIDEVVESMIAGNTYVNLHSADFPSGEIRGQVELEDDRRGKGKDKYDDDDD